MKFSKSFMNFITKFENENGINLFNKIHYVIEKL